METKKTIMKTSDATIKYMCDKEKFIDSMYYDEGGRPTIGFGTLIDTANESWLMNIKIDRIQGMNLFRIDLKIVEDFVNKKVKVQLTQNQFDALVSFTYNVGVGNLLRSTLLRRVNSNSDASLIIPAFMEYNQVRKNKNGKVIFEVSSGLTKRRGEEAKLFIS